MIPIRASPTCTRSIRESTTCVRGLSDRRGGTGFVGTGASASPRARARAVSGGTSFTALPTSGSRPPSPRGAEADWEWLKWLPTRGTSAGLPRGPRHSGAGPPPRPRPDPSPGGGKRQRLEDSATPLRGPRRDRRGPGARSRYRRGIQGRSGPSGRRSSTTRAPCARPPVARPRESLVCPASAASAVGEDVARGGAARVIEIDSGRES